MPMSPSTVRARTKVASPEKSSSSGETTSTCIGIRAPSVALGEPLGLLDGLVDAADHVEGLLGQVVDLAAGDHLEAADRLLDGSVLTGLAGVALRDVHRLGEEPLDLPGPVDRLLVLLGEL